MFRFFSSGEIEVNLLTAGVRAQPAVPLNRLVADVTLITIFPGETL